MVSLTREHVAVILIAAVVVLAAGWLIIETLVSLLTAGPADPAVEPNVDVNAVGESAAGLIVPLL